MAIKFSTIPSGLRKPGIYAEYNATLAVRSLPAVNKKLLLIGQKTASGSADAAAPQELFTEADAALYFGSGSQLHRMARAALTANPYISLHAVALGDHASGVAATGTVTLTGPATAAGTFALWIGHDRIEVPVAVGDTAATVAAALAAAVTARPDLPVTAAQGTDAETHIVTLTAKNKGTAGNQIGLAKEQAGATGLSAVLVAMASGATDPDIATALAAVFAVKYDVVASGFNNLTNLTTLMTYSGSPMEALKTHVQTVSNAMEKRRARAVVGLTGGLSLSTTLADSLNFERQLIAYLRGTRTTSWELAAAYAAVWTGMADPAQPLNYQALAGVHPPAIADRLSRAEQESLLHNGVTPLQVGPGEAVQIVRSITTYQVNPAAAPDTAWLDTTTIDTMDYADFARRTRLETRFPAPKKSDRVKRDIRSELLAVDKQMEDLEILRDIDANKDGYLVEDDPQDPTGLRISVPTPVVPGLHVIGMEQVLYL